MHQGVISTETPDGQRYDYLFRIALKAYIQNDLGEVLVVKEAGRNAWDLPGGGMDHGETVREALARELKEEVGLVCNFSYQPLAIDDPHLLHGLDVYQTRLIMLVIPESMDFTTGVDADEIAFVKPETFIKSEHEVEKKIQNYKQMVKKT